MAEPTPEQKKKNLMTLGLVFCLAIIGFYGFTAFKAAKSERLSPVERAQQRAAELKAQGAVLPPEVTGDASAARDSVNAAREGEPAKDLLPTDNVPGVMPPKPPRPSLDEDAGYDLADFDAGLARGVGLKPGMEMLTARTIITDYFAPGGEEGNAQIAMEQKFLTSGLTQIIVTRTGLADDSVKAEQLLAVFKPLTPKTGQLTAYGMRIKCYRGANTTQWQTELCP